MSGEMFNKSQLCEFEWYKLVMFQDNISPYLDDNFKLEKYQGRSIDIGPDMTAKIVKANGCVLHRPHIPSTDLR